MQVLRTYFKGLLIGCADLVPGVSGATLALLTGIYGRILAVLGVCDVTLLRMLLRGKWRMFFARLQGFFLIPLLCGILSSLLLLAKTLHTLLSLYPVPFYAFFFGSVMLTAHWMSKGLPWRKKPHLLGLVLLGTGVAVCLSLLPEQAQHTTTHLLFLFFSAMAAVCAMLLPGISGSFILLLLGRYELLIAALAAYQWDILLCFALGAGVGFLLFGRLVKWLWQTYAQVTLALLTGIMLGSGLRLWPWRDGRQLFLPAAYAQFTQGSSFFVWALVTTFVGGLLVFLLAPKSVWDE